MHKTIKVPIDLP